MKPIIIVVILGLLSLATFLVVYFGIIKKRDPDDIPRSEVKSKLRTIIEDIEHKDKDPNGLVLQPYVGNHVERKYTLDVKKELIDELPGYEKYYFMTGSPHTTSSLTFDNVKIPINKMTFIDAEGYYWQGDPLLLIVYAKLSESDEYGKDKTQYLFFKRLQSSTKEFERYEPGVDFRDTDDEIIQLVKKINIELHNVFPLDIGMKMDSDYKEINYPEVKKKVKFYKKHNQFSPFDEISMIVRGTYIKTNFQISDFTYKGHTIDINIPKDTIEKAIIYSWNNKPLLIDLKSFSKHHYYRQTGSLEWSRMIDEDNIYAKNRELCELDLRYILETINNEVNNTSYINLSKLENYEYKKKEIIVEKEELETDKNIYVKYTHKMKNKEMQFIIGGYEYNSTFYEELPIGIKIKQMAVYTLNELPLMLEMDIDNEVEGAGGQAGTNGQGTGKKSTKFIEVEEKKGEGYNGVVTREGGNEDKDKQKQLEKEKIQKNKRYFFFNEKSSWEEIEIEGEDIEKIIVDKLDRISGYLGEIIILDVSKIKGYNGVVTREGGNAGTEQSKIISVNFKEERESLYIYTHIPQVKDSNGKLQTIEKATIARVVYKDNIIVGILPTTVTQVDVYMTYDGVGVGVDIDTGLIRKGYTNEGLHVWDRASYLDSRLNLNQHPYYIYTKKDNIVLSFDIGNMNGKNSKDRNAELDHTISGNHITYTYNLFNLENFLLEDLRYKGIKYTSFDTSGLFSTRFTRIRVHYTHDSFVPIIFSLFKGFSEYSYYNDFEGNWRRLPLYYDDYHKNIKIFDENNLRIKGIISIDNYIDYSSEFKTNEIIELKDNKVDYQIQEVGIEEIPNSYEEEKEEELESMVSVKKKGRKYSKVEINVERSIFEKEYTKCKHNLAALTNPVGIIYMGFILKGLPKFKEVESVTAYFKNNIHIPLYIEVIASRTFYHFVNRGNDRWEQVSSSKPLLESLKESEKILSETEMWKTAETIEGDKKILDLSTKDEDKKEKEEKKWRENRRQIK